MKLDTDPPGVGMGGARLGPEPCDGGRCWGTKRDLWLMSYFSKQDQYSYLS